MNNSSRTAPIGRLAITAALLLLAGCDWVDYQDVQTTLSDAVLAGISGFLESTVTLLLEGLIAP